MKVRDFPQRSTLTGAEKIPTQSAADGDEHITVDQIKDYSNDANDAVYISLPLLTSVGSVSANSTAWAQQAYEILVIPSPADFGKTNVEYKLNLYLTNDDAGAVAEVQLFNNFGTASPVADSDVERTFANAGEDAFTGTVNWQSLSGSYFTVGIKRVSGTGDVRLQSPSRIYLKYTD